MTKPWNGHHWDIVGGDMRAVSITLIAPDDMWSQEHDGLCSQGYGCKVVGGSTFIPEVWESFGGLLAEHNFTQALQRKSGRRQNGLVQTYAAVAWKLNVAA
jgi:hypothetical protein